MINKTTQISQSTGDVNYLVIEYLKSIPFNDNNKIFIFVLLCYD